MRSTDSRKPEPAPMRSDVGDAPTRSGVGSHIMLFTPSLPTRHGALTSVSTVIGTVALLILGGGFLWFVSGVPMQEVRLSGKADGIVALTGGAYRIGDAIELLASGRGARLLISGANRTTRLTEISRLRPEFEHWVRCCVDFDRSVNTEGNALETRRWAERHGFRSLIVVTSNYHMPRALAELSHQMPDVELVAFPVITDKQRTERWWTNAATARRMVSEYVKYVFARVRMAIAPAAAFTPLT